MTIVELMVVLVILSILSTIAVGVYSNEVERARYAKARAEIHGLEIAINRYRMDTGQFPPSGSGIALSPINTVLRGSGYAQVALRASLSGDLNNPLSLQWNGPYLEWDNNRLATASGGDPSVPSQLNYLDPWGNRYFYVRNDEYGLVVNGVELGTRLPDGTTPAGVPASPYAATEVYYNATTFQIYSMGANGVTDMTLGQQGTEPDDIANWKGPQL